MRKLMRVAILEVHDKELYISGNLMNYNSKTENIYIADEAGNRIKILPRRATAMDTKATKSQKASQGFFYELSLPFRTGAKYSFICGHTSGDFPLKLHFGDFSKLNEFDGCNFTHGKNLVYADNYSIYVSPNTLFKRIKLTSKYNKRLSEHAPSAVTEIRRKAKHLKKTSKPIWLISDRSDCANDNGMAMFEYLMRGEDGSGAKDLFDIRFVIDKSSPDYEVVKKIGPVVESGTEIHKVLHIASQLLISSAADEWIRNPLGSDLKYYRDLIDTKFIFLQHGVIKDDLSNWLYKLKKNISIFITSAPEEWKSISHGNYGYDESVVKLTGLARFDKLVNTPAKTIAILPTWRRYAASPVTAGTSERPYSEKFKDTEYCKFYNRLINDEALIDCLERNGYKGIYYLHPSHMNQRSDFNGNDTIKVWEGLVPFTQVFNESSLLITDYSSVAIDFAYLGKPVIYTQFDKEKFFNSHTYVEGYYDYEKDGFGPVCYDYENSLNTIINAIEHDCVPDNKYNERIDKFFAYRDRNNCSRIFNEIMETEKTCT